MIARFAPIAIKSVAEAILSQLRRTRIRAGRSLDQWTMTHITYIQARHAETLAPIGSLKNGPIRLLVAARIGKTRLIDNVAV